MSHIEITLRKQSDCVRVFFVCFFFRLKSTCSILALFIGRRSSCIVQLRCGWYGTCEGG